MEGTAQSVVIAMAQKIRKVFFMMCLYFILIDE